MARPGQVERQAGPVQYQGVLARAAINRRKVKGGDADPVIAGGAAHHIIRGNGGKTVRAGIAGEIIAAAVPCAVTGVRLSVPVAPP